MEDILCKKLTKALSPAALTILDESAKHAGHVGARPGGNTHFRIKIVSTAFAKMSRLARHRCVHDILKEELKDQIHALALTLRTPEEDTHDA